MVRGIAAAIAACALAVLLALPPAAGAARIKVTTTGDDFNNNAGDCALREAVQSANTDTDFGGCVRKGSVTPDTIRLTAGQTYTRTNSGAAENANQSGDLDVATPMAIEVKGTGKATIDADLKDRVIQVLAGGKLTASKLILTRGFVLSGQPLNDTSGGGIGVAFDGALSLRNSVVEGNLTTNNENCACGGGIGVGGKTSLKRVRLEDNASFGVGGGVAMIAGPKLAARDSTFFDNESGLGGGGMYLGGFESQSVIEDTTVAENDATGFSNGSGGGIEFAGSSTTAKVTNSTINRNNANVLGGGLFVFSSAVTLNGVTVNDNLANADANASGSGGGIYGAATKARNSIIAGNHDFSATDPEDDCGGSQFVGSHNLYGLDTGCLVSGSDEATLDPRLLPLVDNGGPTETQALRAKSPAIGLGGKSTPKKDQRGVKRDAKPDAGAFER